MPRKIPCRSGNPPRDDLRAHLLAAPGPGGGVLGAAGVRDARHREGRGRGLWVRSQFKKEEESAD